METENGNWKQKQETGNRNRKLKTEMETQSLSCCSESNVFGLRSQAPQSSPHLQFLPSPPPVVVQCAHLGHCSCCQQHSTFGVPYLFSKQLILYKYALHMSCLNQNTTPIFLHQQVFGGAMVRNGAILHRAWICFIHCKQSQLEEGLGTRLQEQECWPCSKTVQVTLMVRLQLVSCPDPPTCEPDQITTLLAT